MSAEQYNPDVEQQEEKIKTPVQEIDVRGDSEQKKADVQRLYSGFVDRFPAAKGSLDAKKNNCLNRLADRVGEAEEKMHDVAESAYEKITGIFH